MDDHPGNNHLHTSPRGPCLQLSRGLTCKRGDARQVQPPAAPRLPVSKAPVTGKENGYANGTSTKTCNGVVSYPQMA